MECAPTSSQNLVILRSLSCQVDNNLLMFFSRWPKIFRWFLTVLATLVDQLQLQLPSMFLLMIPIENVSSAGRSKPPSQHTLECHLILKFNNYCSPLRFDFGSRSLPPQTNPCRRPWEMQSRTSPSETMGVGSRDCKFANSKSSLHVC